MMMNKKKFQKKAKSPTHPRYRKTKFRKLAKNKDGNSSVKPIRGKFKVQEVEDSDSSSVDSAEEKIRYQ